MSGSISPSLEANPLITDWLTFSEQGRITLKTGKVEVGQGVLTALVQIAADELDVKPDCFDILSGDTADGPVEPATSSSISIEQTGPAIRHACAAARHLLLAQAATLLQTEQTALAIENGAVHVDERETPLTLWQLATEVDLARPVTETNNTPKHKAQRRIIGTSLPRLDLEDKIVAPVFIHDLTLEGMLHGRVVQPPSPVHRIQTFDKAALLDRFDNITVFQNGSVVGIISPRERYAVAAAREAAHLIRWAAPAAPQNDILTTLADLDIEPTPLATTGAGAEYQAQQIQLTFSKPYTAHASIAPSCAIATWPTTDTLEILTHTQAPHGLIDGLAIALGIARENITVRHRPGAGTYGHSGQDDVALDAALLARTVPGRPVRVLWSRADDFKASPMAPAMVVRTAASLNADKRVDAFMIEARSQPHARRPGRGGFAEFPNAALLDPPLPEPVPDDVPKERGGGADRNATPLYDFPNLSVQKKIVRDWPVRTSALRGLGAFLNIYAIEAMMDELAVAANTCPVAFRIQHLSDRRAARVIERAAELAGWPGPSGEGEAIGIGFAQYKNKSAYCAVATRVKLEEDVRLIAIHAAVDAGEAINPDGIRNQIEGSILQAASFTLKEAIAVRGNEITTDSWGAYPILTFSEVPTLTVELIDHPDQPSLGIGEAAIGPAAASIGNAVARALGLRLTNLPLTQDAIRAAIHNQQ